MGRWDTMWERQQATIQAAVPEPVVASGSLQPAGTWGSFGLKELSPAVGMFKQHKANQRAGALSTRSALKPNHLTVIAVTADKIYALDAKPSRTNIKVVGTLAAWNRRDVTVEMIPGRVSTRVVFDHVDGGHYELESTNVGGYNGPLLDALTSPAAG
jgi:hypothetical protein